MTTGGGAIGDTALTSATNSIGRLRICKDADLGPACDADLALPHAYNSHIGRTEEGQQQFQGWNKQQTTRKW